MKISLKYFPGGPRRHGEAEEHLRPRDQRAGAATTRESLSYLNIL